MSGLNSESLLEGLTEPQKQAVTHVDGPLLIVAGAGSGKTRVITRRVAHLISLGIPAPSILAITFTNKAAGEMKERVSAVLDRPLRDFGRLDQRWPTDLHVPLAVSAHPAALCDASRVCRRIRHLRHLDQTKLIKEALKVLELSTTNFSPGTVHGAISNAKNQLVSPEQFAGNARDYFQRNIARVYAKYQAMLRAEQRAGFR